jgi:hypothetical protein
MAVKSRQTKTLQGRSAAEISSEAARTGLTHICSHFSAGGLGFRSTLSLCIGSRQCRYRGLNVNAHRKLFFRSLASDIPLAGRFCRHSAENSCWQQNFNSSCSNQRFVCICRSDLSSDTLGPRGNEIRRATGRPDTEWRRGYFTSVGGQESGGIRDNVGTDGTFPEQSAHQLLCPETPGRDAAHLLTSFVSLSLAITRPHFP